MDHVPDLRKVAREALRHYAITPRRITKAAESFTTVYRVTAEEGSFALRIGAEPQIHAGGTLRAEAAWLQRLREGGVLVPGVVPTVDGEAGTDVGGRTCALFEWVAGRSLRTRLTGPTAAALGRLSARLHEDAVAWELPPLDVLVADQVLYWRLPNLLTSPDVPHSDVFTAALERAEFAVRELWATPPHRPHLLHGDLTPANAVLTRGGAAVPIDFQDLVVGFDVQDLAISLAALRRVSAGTRAEDAFRAGYASVRAWPEASPALMEALLAGRALHQINLTLNEHGSDGLDNYRATRAERLRAWLR
jgi:Ser/Thr protein kinase RdoA (MazF antagonist)